MPFCFRVGLVAPEEGEVVEDLLGLVEVGNRLGCDVGDLDLDLLAAREVFGAVEIGELVQVTKATQPLLERDPLPRDLLRFRAGLQ